ncbi:glutamate 5-kinase [Niallia endozanthoxylica]|uniref:Glutamate 5-kinase n=1 Tax=Niallia endozanthoxylica TaxID=2036016 RepID=A0A5J5HM55_9BACI|nr:glutamate 5-kinase [Niallia endozanthoxylica]KAA9021640.1 glutamate 5-kinase [Niallia endozanthoxylica]
MTSNSKVQRIVIKIGSSSLTSRHGEISHKKLEKLADEIVQLKDLGHEVVLVSSGAIAAGYRKLGCLKRPNSLPEKQAAASIGQGLLMESYSKLFLANGYVASQILITRGDFLDEDRYKNMRNTLNVLLERGIIPIVNENDTVTIDRLKFGDNDTLSAKVAGLIDADQLVILSDIDGLYDADPSKHVHAVLVEHVNEITPEIEATAGGSGSSVGTGGMKSKIEAVKIAMASGITTFLGNASKRNIVKDAVIGKARGTYFKTETPASNFNQRKKWIAFHSHPEGEMIITNQAKIRMVEDHKSLLPSGINYINGQFDKGAVIRIIDSSGHEVGCGVVNYSNEELLHLLKHKNHTGIGQPYVMDINHFVCHLDVPITV